MAAYRCERCGSLAEGRPVMVNGWRMDPQCAADVRAARKAIGVVSDAIGSSTGNAANVKPEGSN